MDHAAHSESSVGPFETRRLRFVMDFGQSAVSAVLLAMASPWRERKRGDVHEETPAAPSVERRDPHATRPKPRGYRDRDVPGLDMYIGSLEPIDTPLTDKLRVPRSPQELADIARVFEASQVTIKLGDPPPNLLKQPESPAAAGPLPESNFD
jgi:hypothetical protein